MATRGVSLISEWRRDTWFACGTGAVAFVVYLLALPPSYGMWDTAESQTVTAILGIAHPPGSPAFTLLGYAAVHAFPFGEAASRLNVMCAFAASVSVGLAYATARRFEASRTAAVIAALAFAFALVTWRDATRAEVLDVATCLRVAALTFGLRWVSNGNARDLYAMAFAGALACATHGLSLFVLPSLVLLAFGGRERLRLGTLVTAAACFLAGFLPYAYLPLRSLWIDAHRLDPMLALGLPSGLPFWNYGDPSTWTGFVHFVTGADFHVRGGFEGFASLARYPHFAAQMSRQVASAYGYAGTVLALGGACLLVASRRLDRIAIVLAALLPVPYTESYSDLQDRERYYLLTLWCAAIAIAVAFERLADLFELRRKTIGRAGLAFALALSFATVGPERAMMFDQRHDRKGPDYVADVRSFTPDDAIVMADWSYATPLAYAGYVDDAIGRRTVIAASPRQYLAYAARWIRTRPVYFVGFDSDLELPGWRVRRVKSGAYYAYRLSK